MAKVLQEFVFTGINHRSKYAWDKWLDGKIWRLERGVDYFCADSRIRFLIRRTALGIGKSVSIASPDDGVTVLQLQRQEHVGSSEEKGGDVSWLVRRLKRHDAAEWALKKIGKPACVYSIAKYLRGIDYDAKCSDEALVSILRQSMADRPNVFHCVEGGDGFDKLWSLALPGDSVSPEQPATNVIGDCQ